MATDSEWPRRGGGGELSSGCGGGGLQQQADTYSDRSGRAGGRSISVSCCAVAAQLLQPLRSAPNETQYRYPVASNHRLAHRVVGRRRRLTAAESSVERRQRRA